MFEHRIRKNPLAAHRNDDGQVQFRTGDPQLDKWESEYVRGLTPNLWESMTPAQRAAEAKAIAQDLRAEAAQGRVAGVAGSAPGGTDGSSVGHSWENEWRHAQRLVGLAAAGGVTDV